MANLVAALARLDATQWMESPTQHGRIMWLPLWLMTASGLWVGLDNQAQWVVGRISGQTAEPGRLSPSWLPLLDNDEALVRAELEHASTKYDLPLSELLESIPIDAVISLALSGSNPHWIDRALMWLEHRSIPDNTRSLVVSVLASKSASQSARHRARRLLRRGLNGAL